MIQVHSGKRGKYNNAATGTFIPQHPEKYIGKSAPVYKSGLEFRCMRYLDSNPYVVQWSYEPQYIQYLDKSCRPPRQRRYFIDFKAVIKTGGICKTVLLEVKPLSETVMPKNPKNMNAMLLWIKNSCKWDAARQYAKSKGCEFHVITEAQLN